MNPRQRRLKADFEKLKEEFTGHKFIEIDYDESESTPERYFVTFKNIKGYKQTEDSSREKRKVEIINEHRIEIYLHIDYPRLKPQSFILTPVFHPNFRMAAPHDICIGDYWASGETLTDIIYQIGEMIMYQNYNTTSPLNGIAAKWARENTDMLPADNKNIRRGDVNVDLKKNDEVKIEFRR
jgi:ubiquitin-protein ligase